MAKPKKSFSSVQKNFKKEQVPQQNLVQDPAQRLYGQSPYQHRAHTQGSFVENLKVSTHSSTGSTHRGTLKTKILTRHSIEPTHMGTLKLKVFTHHSTEPTPRGTLKIRSPHTPQHRAHTQGNFEKSQSLYTPQHRAHTQRFFKDWPNDGTFKLWVRKRQSLGGGLLYMKILWGTQNFRIFIISSTNEMFPQKSRFPTFQKVRFW